MCGFVGIFGFKNLDEKTLIKMGSSLYSRGPDDNGIYIDHPSQIDFSAAYNSYMYALSIDQNDPNANFGAALTSFLMITQDPILWQVFEEWDQFNGLLIPIDDESGGRASTASIISFLFFLSFCK